MGGAGFEGDDLRAASGAVDYAVGEAPHLGVATLAGVLAQRVRQGDYLLQGPQDRTLNVAAARVALDRVEPSSAELAAPARRAYDGIRLRCRARSIARDRIFISCSSFTARRLVATNATRW